MWQAIGASSLGTSHLRSHLPCQDAHQYWICEHGVVAAVADGLGSASYADTGATITVDQAVKVMAPLLVQHTPETSEAWEQAMTTAFTQARHSLVAQAQQEGAELRDYATTLLVAVVTAEWLAVGHIGDGAVVAEYEDGQVETVSQPERGEYANSVLPLTTDNPYPHIRYCIQQTSVKSIALLTDGLQLLSINQATGVPYIPFFKPFFDAIGHRLDPEEASSQLMAFLDSERICARTEDDKTLVIVGRVDELDTEQSSGESHQAQ